ncbi:MAG: hypothetical protein GEU99_13860 [Luteitalea sp.]|nr:hypothetical protein [Luteitalea sp.]
MDDRPLYALRTEPSPEFAQQLRERLKRQGGAVGTQEAQWPTRRVIMTAMAVVGVALAFMLPSVRASAQAFLDLFRVVNFTAVPVDHQRAAQLRSEELDIERLIGSQVEMLVNPGPPRSFASPEMAGAAAGFEVRLPRARPAAVELTGILLAGERAVRVTGDSTKLQHVLDTLGIHDVRAPEALHGQTATLRIPPVVRVRYRYEDQQLDFLQGRSPEISLPAGLDLPALGEIGLRILGLEQGEAGRLAQAIDWRNTLLVPVPISASSFRHVEVHGNRGLLIGTAATAGERPPNILVWSEEGYVYGMVGQFQPKTLLEMAHSVQ